MGPSMEAAPLKSHDAALGRSMSAVSSSPFATDFGNDPSIEAASLKSNNAAPNRSMSASAGSRMLPEVHSTCQMRPVADHNSCINEFRMLSLPDDPNAGQLIRMTRTVSGRPRLSHVKRGRPSSALPKSESLSPRGERSISQPPEDVSRHLLSRRSSHSPKPLHLAPMA